MIPAAGPGDAETGPEGTVVGAGVTGDGPGGAAAGAAGAENVAVGPKNTVVGSRGAAIGPEDMAVGPESATARPEDTAAGPGDEQLNRVFLTRVLEPGDETGGRWVRELGADAVVRRLRDRGEPLPGASAKRWAGLLARAAHAQPHRDLAMAHDAGVRFVLPDTTEWPRQLDDLGDARPLGLWVRGTPDLRMWALRSVAVVGARACTAYGAHMATTLSAGLAERGWIVVSGGAYGIDGAAHRAALAVGGATVALLAGGADRAYPAGHTRLLDDIAASGAVVSEVPCGSAPTKWRFLQRNGVIAAVSDATVVVEAGWRSGSLNTAGHAAALARGLGAVPGPVTSAASAGTHRLLREYGATCITSAPDVRELLGLADVGAVGDSGGGAGARTDDSTRVRDALSTRAWRHAEDVARRAGLATADAEAILGLLHLEGAVVRSPEGWRLAGSTGRVGG